MCFWNLFFGNKRALEDKRKEHINGKTCGREDEEEEEDALDSLEVRDFFTC